MSYDPNYDPRKDQRQKDVSNTEYLENATEFTSNCIDAIGIMKKNFNEDFFPHVDPLLEKISNTFRQEITVSKRDELNAVMWDIYNNFVKFLATQNQLLNFLQKPKVLPVYKSKT